MEGQYASQYPQYSVNACEKTFLQDLFSSNSLERSKELSKEESPKGASGKRACISVLLLRCDSMQERSPHRVSTAVVNQHMNPPYSTRCNGLC